MTIPGGRAWPTFGVFVNRVLWSHGGSCRRSLCGDPKSGTRSVASPNVTSRALVTTPAVLAGVPSGAALCTATLEHLTCSGECGGLAAEAGGLDASRGDVVTEVEILVEEDEPLITCEL